MNVKQEIKKILTKRRKYKLLFIDNDFVCTTPGCKCDEFFKNDVGDYNCAKCNCRYIGPKLLIEKLENKNKNL